jgi:hypothetical protein
VASVSPPRGARRPDVRRGAETRGSGMNSLSFLRPFSHQDRPGVAGPSETDAYRSGLPRSSVTPYLRSLRVRAFRHFLENKRSNTPPCAHSARRAIRVFGPAGVGVHRQFRRQGPNARIADAPARDELQALVRTTATGPRDAGRDAAPAVLRCRRAGHPRRPS